ncbi:replication initiator protein A [Bacillus sp. BP-3]|uniref:replication initiator protein A n=1 Tax=Bacillus sp. BP-3 TaxID=3022773 RepID=UPI0023301660|nr:replication initiator protein A [Bacillus sp. BP-3]MDC2867546.1 replication initiator protein A [Bacillus sp. BP-3]
MYTKKQGQKISGKQATKEAYIKLHEFLMFDENYRTLSSNAKLLYSFLRNKVTYFKIITEEAEMTGAGTRSYRDDEGYIFCIADNTELCYILNVAESTLIRVKKELHTFGLLSEVNIKDKANRIYVLDPVDLQERWEYIQTINNLRQEKKKTNQEKAKKHAEKKKNSRNLQNESHGNLQNESHGNLQNESKLELNLSDLELNIFEFKPKHLSIWNKVKSTSLFETTQIVIGRKIDRMNDKKLEVIVSLFEIYKSAINEVAFNAVLNRVLDSTVRTSFKGLLEKSLKTEIASIPIGEQPSLRKELVPDWVKKQDEEAETEQTGTKLSLDEEQRLLDEELKKYKRA